MLYESLSYQRDDRVLVINLVGFENRQERRPQMSDELSDLCTAMTLDKDVRVVIICWERGDSSSGADLCDELLRCGESGTEFWPLADLIGKLDRPVIVAINGNAVGQSLGLALACDMRIASESSHFGLPYINAGMIPWDGGTQRLARLVGKAKAMEMVLTGEIIDSHEAYRIGLVNRIVPSDQLSEVVLGMAHEMASKGPIALRYAKEAIQKGMDLTLEQGLRLEADLYFLLHTTRDRTEGIKAYQEKRDPQFEGR